MQPNAHRPPSFLRSSSVGAARDVVLALLAFVVVAVVLVLAATALAVPAGADDGGGGPPLPPPDETPTSPVRRLERGPVQPPNPSPPASPFRSIDGWGNNLAHQSVGGANTQLLRLLDPDYGDALSSMAGADRPSPRAISNSVCAQTESRPNPLGVTDYLWQWGQFLDHDIDLTDGVDPAEPADIAVHAGDVWFDPDATGDVVMPFNRSVYDPETGIDGPRAPHALRPRAQPPGPSHRP